MYRDTLDANAANVLLDAKPDGGVEFMARLCRGCATTCIAGTNITFPAYLSLSRDGSVFYASVYYQEPGDGTNLGSVTVPVSQPYAGFAVTSHDANAVTTAVLDNPPR